MGSLKCTTEADGTVYKIKSVNMKERMLTGWTFTRVIYVALGSFVLIQSVIEKQWPGIVFGGYFASMGLFAFGCAAGNCFGGRCSVEQETKSDPTISEIDLKEEKTN